MEITVDIDKWSIMEINGDKKITGSYTIKTGALVIASQSFNGEYGTDMKLPFSPEIMVQAYALTNAIRDEITNHFKGGK